MDLGNPELTDITGKRCLRHVETMLRKQGGQLFLVGHLLLGDDFPDLPLAFQFSSHNEKIFNNRPKYMHNFPIYIQIFVLFLHPL